MSDKGYKHRLIILSLFVSLLVVIIAAVSLGAVKIGFTEVIRVLIANLPLINPESIAAVNRTIIFRLRLPRVLLAGLVGLALASSGTVFQALFKNPMADPYVIGISSGASLGATLGIIFELELSFGGLQSIPLFAFGGALLTILTVYNLARTGNRVPVGTLLLAGVALGSFLSALVSLLMVFNRSAMEQIVFWMMGSLSGQGWPELRSSWFYIGSGYLVVQFLTRELNLIVLGDESAHSLGLEVESVKKMLLVSGSLLAGAAVAVSGVIGFVGLIIPHIVRLLVGPDHKILLPAAALGGAIFLIIADTFARLVVAPTELPVGIVTSLFGAPFFLYLLQKRKTRFY